MKSTLQGLFLDYQATLEHEDRFGEGGASVFEGVEIHELIHQVEAGGAFSDGKPDFLVNDGSDPDDLPDTLHLSDGSTAPVTVVREAVAGRQYAFYPIARDTAGNVEPAPATPDAATMAIGNSAPDIEPIADVTLDEGQRTEVQLRGTDLDLPGDTLRYGLVAGPAGASIAADTGRFAWQTGEADGPATHTIRVRVSDDGEPSASVERSFRVVVREINQPVTLQAVGTGLAADEGQPFRLRLIAEDPDLPANSVRFSLVGSIIGGVSVALLPGRGAGMMFEGRSSPTGR